MSQLFFNPDGSIALPSSVQSDLKKRREEKKSAELDIWDNGEEDESEKFNVGDDVSGFNLYKEGVRLSPLKFSNGKSQADVVDEVVHAIDSGKKVIFIRGVCGTGKCLDKDSLVFCKPNGENCFSYYKISELGGKEGKIISLDRQGSLVEADFKNVRKTGRKKLFKLKTRTGREILASANHPFLTITENGKKWKILEQLNTGSYICLPNRINIKDNLELDDNEIKVLAHLIAEGKLGDKVGSPKYFQCPKQNPEIRKDYISSLSRLFPEGKIVERREEVTMKFGLMNTTKGTTNKLRLFIREYGLDKKKSGEKFVPKIIFGLKKEKIALFLNRLFSCDGSIYLKKEQVIIEYSSISKRLVQDVSLLLDYFGLQHTIASKRFRDNQDYSWRIFISNQESLRKYISEIGFIGRKQKRALKVLKILKKHKFTNIDKVPRIIREYLKNKGYSYLEQDRFLNYAEILKLKESKSFKEIRKDSNIKTPCVFKQSKIDFLRSHICKVNNQIKDEVLSFICNEDIIWDKVISKEFVKEDETYDLEVPELSNFVSNGIIVHNSAIALNIAKALGRASVVVPGKSLQRQYWKDYSHDSYVLKEDNTKLKIKVITGRENHRCLYSPRESANGALLPCKIEIKESNIGALRQYLKENPKVKNELELKDIRRMSVAPVCPYWSPILPSHYSFNFESEKKRYKGLKGIEFTIYNRKKGCSYYNQFNAYAEGEAIVFNSAKYELESAMNRKPATDVEIIDECDEFLDSFSSVKRINLNRLFNSLTTVFPEDESVNFTLEKVLKWVGEILQDRTFKEIPKEEIFHIKDTKIYQLLRYLVDNTELINEVDEDSYVHSVAEIAYVFEELMDETYVSFSSEERGLYVDVVSVNLSGKFKEMLDKNQAFVMMSGTIHSENILKNIFGIDDYVVIDAEVVNQGKIEVKKTGMEVDCKYENFRSGEVTREDYLRALEKCVEVSEKPVLVHVNAFSDLPSRDEIGIYDLKNLISADELVGKQRDDRENVLAEDFKKKGGVLFTTKCSRGVDFPGGQCNSIVFTKYPNPNAGSVFWRILKKVHGQWYWEFYKDKAYREFLQKIYRGVRSKDDKVYILSPDVRVLESVDKLNVLKEV